MVCHPLARRHLPYFKRSGDRFKSRAPRFEIKVRNVGLNIHPPLGRTQQPLPMKPGQAETQTPDDPRHDPIGLLAALDIATGKVVGQMTERHRSADVIAFLEPVDGGIEPGTPVQVILNNVSSHQSVEVHEWLKSRPDGTFHFPPTLASWMNAVEGYFSQRLRHRLKNAVFNPVDECLSAIKGDIASHHAHDSCPFRWSRKPDDLLTAWKRGHQKLPEMAFSE